MSQQLSFREGEPRNSPTPQAGSLEEAIAALRNDLLSDDGPEISTMRNYRFAILPYDPQQEYRLRQHIHRLTHELKGAGWNVLSIALHKLLLDRLRAMPQENGRDVLTAWIEREKSLTKRGNPDRALQFIKERVSGLIEGPDGIAADVVRLIGELLARNPGTEDRSVVFLGRAGALYPFFRTSALLRHIDGRTGNVPVVMLYPGARHDANRLSFMGELLPDGDYRPRIYP